MDVLAEVLGGGGGGGGYMGYHRQFPCTALLTSVVLAAWIQLTPATARLVPCPPPFCYSVYVQKRKPLFRKPNNGGG